MNLKKWFKSSILIPVLCLGMLLSQFNSIIPVVYGEESIGAEVDSGENSVTVSKLKIEWAGNNGGQDFLLIYLDGASYTTYNVADNESWSKFADYIYVNDVSLKESGLTAWAQKGMYGDSACYSVWLNRGTTFSLKNDGTDVIEIRKDCQFSMENSSDNYKVSETVKFQSPSINGEGITSCKKVFEYKADYEYDTNADIIEENADDFIGGNRVHGFTIADLDMWGLTRYAAYTPNTLSQNEFVRVQFANPIDSNTFKTIKLKVMYNNPSTFYAFEGEETEFTKTNAGGVFETTTSVVEISLSSKEFAVSGKVSSILFQLQDNNAAQFFVDSVTLLTTEAESPKPEPEPTFEYQADVEYDAGEDIFYRNPEVSINGLTVRPWVGQGEVGIGTGKVLHTAGSNENNHLEKGDAVILKFVHPVDVSEFKTIKLKVLVGAVSEFCIYGEDTATFTEEDAGYTFTTDGTIQTLELSGEAFKNAEGQIHYLVFQLTSSEPVQFFVDSLTLLTTEPVKPNPEPTFAYQKNVEYDADDSIFQVAGDGKIGNVATKATYVEDINRWGITNYAYYTSDVLNKGDAVVIAFKHEIDASIYKTIDLTLFYNASAGFYVYRGNETVFDYSHAKQSFEIANGLQTIRLASSLFADEHGKVKQIIVQLQTINGAQFFVDSLKVSTDSYTPAPVAQFNINYSYHEVEVTDVQYTREYAVGAGQDILWVYFSDDIVPDSNEGVRIDNLKGISDHIAINGQLIENVAVYAVAGLWHKTNAVAIFLDNVKEGSINNDGFDSLKILSGMEVMLEKSKNNVSVYKVTKEISYYFNEMFEDSLTYVLETTFNPPETDPTALNVYSVEAIYGDTEAVLTVTFDKKFGAITSENEKKIKEYIRFNGSMLSNMESVSLVSHGRQLKITVSMNALHNDGKDVLELLVGLGVPGAEKGFTLKKNLTYRSLEPNAKVWHCDSTEKLNIYYVANPKVKDGLAELRIKTSCISRYKVAYNSSVLSHIKLNTTALQTLLKNYTDSSFRLDGKYLVICVPATFLKNGMKLTIEKGFRIPTGETIERDTVFVYDSEFERFSAERVELPDDVKTRNVSVDEVAMGIDGVEKGTTQLFVKFNNIVCRDYLPAMQLGAYDLSELCSIFTEVNASDMHISQLDQYGMIDSVMNYILIDGLSVREWLLKDKESAGSDWCNSIQVNYIGSVFDPHYLQIVLNKTSSAVMDEGTTHEITFKEGYITPEFGVLREDVSFLWDAEKEIWSKKCLATQVDAYVEAKATDYWTYEVVEESGQILPVVALAVVALGAVGIGTVLIIRKRRRQNEK